MVKKISLSLAFVLLFTAVTIPSFSAKVATFGFPDEESRTSYQLDAAIFGTNVKTAKGSYYGKQNINYVEFNPKVNEFDYCSNGGGKSKTSNIISDFSNNTQKNITPLAAVNASLWTMCNNSAWNPSDLTKNGQYLQIPRGFVSSDGKILYTTDNQNEYSNTAYWEQFYSYCVNNDGKAYICCPRVSFDITNSTRSSSCSTYDLNRLPGDDMLIVYSDEGINRNYCKDEVYEVVINCGDYAVKPGAKITGRVESVYPCGTNKDGVRSQNGKIILYAKGYKVDESAIDGYNVGDDVSVDVSIVDLDGQHTGDLNDVKTAVCGHNPYYSDSVLREQKRKEFNINFLIDGQPAQSLNGASYAMTIIGVKQDGTSMVLTTDKTPPYTGLYVDDNLAYDEYCSELGLKSAMWLDGGGSTTMAQINENSDGYDVINYPSDADGERAVIDCAIISRPSAKVEMSGTISSKNRTNKVVDIQGGSRIGGANAQLYNSNTTLAQHFDFVKLDSGNYLIRNVLTGMVLESSGGSSSVGTHVKQHYENRTAAQQWRIVDRSDGYCSIVNASNELYLDYYLEYALSIEYQNDGSDTQKFMLNDFSRSVIENGAYTISPMHAENMALDVSGGSASNGQNIQIYRKNSSDAQTFNVINAGNNLYRIDTKVSNCSSSLDVLGGIPQNYQNVQQFASNNSPAQLWYIIPSKDSESYYLVSNTGGSGYTLDVNGGGIVNHTNVQIYSQNNSKAQKFIFTKTS